MFWYSARISEDWKLKKRDSSENRIYFSASWVCFKYACVALYSLVWIWFLTGFIFVYMRWCLWCRSKSCRSAVQSRIDWEEFRILYEFDLRMTPFLVISDSGISWRIFRFCTSSRKEAGRRAFFTFYCWRGVTFIPAVGLVCNPAHIGSFA